MGKYFGTDGFRGEANVTLTVEHAFKVGRFLAGITDRSISQGSSSEKTPEEAVICLNMHW